MNQFVQGLRLSEMFFRQVVRDIIEAKFPDLKYSAALFGWGSETLGYDTVQSSDHHWGPRLILFLNETDYLKFSGEIKKELANKLPYEFMGYSTNFGEAASNGVRVAKWITIGPVNHMVDIFTIRSFWHMRLRFDPYQEISIFDWLSFPQQRLLEVTSGEVYYDGLGELNKIRERFSYFPKGMWLHILANQWSKISQEEAFVGRAGDVGDELGSQIVASRIVRELMVLCFLMEQKYFPYSKWFGTAFSKLAIAAKISPALRDVLLSTSWKEREAHLSQAYKIVGETHNALQITPPLDTSVSLYHGRPYLVMHTDKFAATIRNAIKDEELKNIRTDIGSIDQFIDSTEIFSSPLLSRKLVILLKSSEQGGPK